MTNLQRCSTSNLMNPITDQKLLKKTSPERAQTSLTRRNHRGADEALACHRKEVPKEQGGSWSAKIAILVYSQTTMIVL